MSQSEVAAARKVFFIFVFADTCCTAICSWDVARQILGASQAGHNHFLFGRDLRCCFIIAAELADVARREPASRFEWDHFYAQEKGRNQDREGSAAPCSRWYWYAACAATDPGQATQTSETQTATTGFRQKLSPNSFVPPGIRFARNLVFRPSSRFGFGNHFSGLEKRHRRFAR